MRQRGALEALGDVAAQPGRVLDRLEEEGVLLMRFFWFFLFWWPGRGKKGEGKREKSVGREAEEKRTKKKKEQGQEPKNKRTSTPLTPNVLFVQPTDITRIS